MSDSRKKTNIFIILSHNNNLFLTLHFLSLAIEEVNIHMSKKHILNMFVFHYKKNNK
jgi:hypothetical protein